MAERDRLLIPEAAQRDAQSFEILRVWIAEKGQHVSIRAGVWRDPAAWGLMLADLATHIANVYKQDAALDGTQTLQRIKDALLIELDTRTDAPR